MYFMPSAIWSGSVGFGLVQVPVRIVTATRNRDVSFNQLEEGTGARIRYRKVSDVTGDEVTADKLVRGYEVSKGKYVLIEDEEIQSLRPKGSHAIEIEEFVDLDEIDPLYFEQPYYLVPDARGVKPYKLLVEAMQEMNKVAIGRIIERKAGGEEIVAEPVVEAPAKVLDLVAALEASLEKAQGAKERHPSVAAA